MRILNLGWGVQSFTLAVMAALGDIEPLTAAVHADTTWEKSQTYEFAEIFTPWLKARGVNVVTVSAGEQPKKATTGQTDCCFFSTQVIDQYQVGGEGTCLPAFTGAKNNIKKGQLRRQCTSHWKIDPIRRWVRAHRQGREQVHQLIGISLDEAHRMKPAQVKYVTHEWPLIDKRMTRSDCRAYLEKNGLPIPLKSSCVFCPFHKKTEWAEIKKNPKDWVIAVDVDRKIRNVRPPYDLYLLSSCEPLEEADLSTPEDRGQMTLWQDECTGFCGN